MGRKRLRWAHHFLIVLAVAEVVLTAADRYQAYPKLDPFDLLVAVWVALSTLVGWILVALILAHRYQPRRLTHAWNGRCPTGR